MLFASLSFHLAAQSYTLDFNFGSPVREHLFIPERNNLFINGKGLFYTLEQSQGTFLYGGVGLLSYQHAFTNNWACSAFGGPILIRSNTNSYDSNGLGLGLYSVNTLYATPELQIISFIGPTGLFMYTEKRGEFVINVPPEVYISENVYGLSLQAGLQVDHIFPHWIFSYYASCLGGGLWTDSTIHNFNAPIEAEAYPFASVYLGFDLMYRPLGISLSSIATLDIAKIIYNLMLHIPLTSW